MCCFFSGKKIQLLYQSDSVLSRAALSYSNCDCKIFFLGGQWEKNLTFFLQNSVPTDLIVKSINIIWKLLRFSQYSQFSSTFQLNFIGVTTFNIFLVVVVGGWWDYIYCGLDWLPPPLDVQSNFSFLKIYVMKIMEPHISQHIFYIKYSVYRNLHRLLKQCWGSGSKGSASFCRNRIRKIFQYCSSLTHPFPPPSHLIFHPSSLTQPPEVYPSSITTHPSPLIPHP